MSLPTTKPPQKTSKKPKNKPNRAARALRATAYHEAGHAVALWAQGLRFREASITTDEKAETLGRVIHRNPKWFDPGYGTSDRHRVHAEKHIITDFAGKIAEDKFLRRRVREGFWQDYQNAFDMAYCFCGTPKTANAFMQYLFYMARDLIQTRWWAVVAVANELVAKKHLRHKDVVAVINRAMQAMIDAKSPMRLIIEAKPSGKR